MGNEEEKETLKDLKKIRGHAKGKFTRKVKVLQECIDKDEPDEVLSSMKDEVCACFTNVEKCNDDIISELEDSTAIDECQEYIIALEREKCRIVSSCVLKQRAAAQGKCAPSKNVLVKKLEPPRFNGNVREYPTFVKDFQRLMVSQHGQDPYVLRQSLSGKALDIVGGIDEYDKMWERLEERFGCTTKLVDSVLAEIDHLKAIPEGSSKRMIDMVNTVERAWLDLKKLDKQREIENAVTLSKIERILPVSLKREWVIKSRSLDDEEKFKGIVEFLVEERNAIEYMEEDARRTGRTHVAVHNLEQNVNEPSSGLASAIENFARNQENCQKQLLECFTNLSQAMMNIAEKGSKASGSGSGRFSGSSSGRFSGGFNLNNCWFHRTDGHDILECEAFKRLSDEAKFEHLMQWGVCFLCLKSCDHIARNCKGRACNVTYQGTVCGKFHHPLIHSLFPTSVPSVKASSNFMDRQGVLLAIKEVRSGVRSLLTLFDSGSNITMITHDAAGRLGLRGQSVSLSVTKVGNKVEHLDSKAYMVPLLDEHGQEWMIEACGIEEISSNVSKTDMSEIAKLFGVHTWQIARPEGKIELLIGSDYCSLLPKVVRSNGNLQLLQGNFGLCVRGRSSSIDGKSCINVSVNHLVCAQPDDLLACPKADVPKLINDFFNSENAGVHYVPRCGSCRCGKCSLNEGLTLREQREFDLINEGLEYNESEMCWIAAYPWIRDPKELPNNLPLAHARLKSTEKRLQRLGDEYAKNYQKQMEDMKLRGVARKLSPEEITAYEGPVYYLPHHEIVKADSLSTPLRIVFNSSATYLGSSLNSFLCQGPDFLNSLVGVLLRFRQGYIGFAADIKKMYNSVKIGELEQHTHRFLWRDMRTSVNPDHYVLTTVTFGDKPGGAIAMAALRKTAERFEDSPEVTNLIVKNSYVDDLLGSVDSKYEAEDLMARVEKVLEKGGFHIKKCVMSGVTKENVSMTGTEKVLGLLWEPETDRFVFKLNLRFCKVSNKGNIKPAIRLEELEREMPSILTKRIILSQVASLYDPLGFVNPVTLKAKLMMRNLVKEASHNTPGKGWDEPVDQDTYQEWEAHFKRMFELEQLQFERCLKPVNAVGNPSLVIFSDGSTVAYGAVAYLRWLLVDGSYKCKLICSKSRLAPTRQLSIPRIELCGAVIGCRLRELIQRELDWTIEHVTHFTDSEIVKAQIQKDSFRFNTFVANRISEIQALTSSDEWYWIPSEVNVADYTTRVCNCSMLGINSMWQDGPGFLRCPVENWPIKRVCDVEVPDLTYSRKGSVKCTVVEEALIDIDKFNDYNKLISVTSRVLNVLKAKSLLEMFKNPDCCEMEEAELFWVRLAQKSLDKNWRTRYQRLGLKMQANGVITVGSRIKSWLKNNWNREEYILLPSQHAFTKLYMQYLHDRDHSGVESTLAKLQAKYWVPRARKIIRAIKAKCIMCRRIDKICEGQTMGELPEERLKPSPPFYNTSVDLFGPMYVKDVVKKRTQLKVYGVLFNCLASRAVYIDLAEGYDTSSFLKVFRRFVALRGFPKIVYSDRGTQLVGANKQLDSMLYSGDEMVSELWKFSVKGGTVWKFTKSANSPWQNGCAEALIKSVKRCIQISVGENVLSYGELQTVMFEIANLINERPIGMKPGCDIDRGSYLSPNDLLLGRSRADAPQGAWDLDSKFSQRYVYLSKVVDCFWRKWIRDYFPTLMVRSKWHTDKRNLQKGDVVLIQDTNALKGNWRLGEVEETRPGVDGKVRNVSVRYKVSQPGKKYVGQRDITVDRPAQRIVVILPIEEQ